MSVSSVAGRARKLRRSFVGAPFSSGHRSVQRMETPKDLGWSSWRLVSAGLPVVAYRRGGVEESVVDGQTGLLAPEGDIERLAQLVECLLRDPELAHRLGTNGRTRVEQQFDVRVLTAKLEDVYSELSAAPLNPRLSDKEETWRWQGNA